jgi:hypothetical protein
MVHAIKEGRGRKKEMKVGKGQRQQRGGREREEETVVSSTAEN